MGRGSVPGEFEQIVLLALAGLEGPQPGRAVFDRIVAETGREPSVAAVHITLARVCEKGWATRETSPPDPHVGGKPRRYYRLAAAGAEVLREQRRQLDRLWGDAADHPLLSGDA